MLEPPSIIFFLFFILVLGVYCRRPYFDFPLDEDAGFYTYLPHFENRGIRFLRDFWGMFPPTLLFMIRWVCRTFRNEIHSVRVFATLWHGCVIFSVFWLARYLFGTEAALTSAFLYSIYASVPFLTWFSIHSENYYLLPVTWGLYFCTLGIESHSALFCAVSGLFFAAGFLIKIVVMAYVFFLGGYLCVEEGWNTIYFLAGFALPVMAYTAVLAWSFYGQVRELLLHMRLRFAGFRNFSGRKSHTGEWKRDIRKLLFQTSPVWLGAALWILDPPDTALQVYGLATLFILIAQRGYSSYHYLPLIHLLCIQTGGLLGGIAAPGAGPFSIPVLYGALVLILVHGVKTVFQCRSASGQYSAFEKSDQYAYLPAMARDFQKKIPQDERLYVWGSYNQVYQLCDRMATDQYFFFLSGPYHDRHLCHFYDSIVGGIIRYQPRYILQTHHTLNMRALSEITGYAYIVDRVYFNKFRLWRREGTTAKRPPPPASWQEKNQRLEAISSGDKICGLDDFYFQERRFREGERECRAALELNPNDFDNLLYLGVLLRESNREEEAIKTFEALLAGCGEKRLRFEGHWKMGITLKETGRQEEAIVEFSHAEALVSCVRDQERRRRLAGIFLNRGIARRLAGDLEGALQEFSRAEACDPSLQGIHLQLGVTLQETGRQEQAWEALEKEAEKFPVNPEAFLYMGIIKSKQGRYPEGLHYFDRALSLNPPPGMRSFLCYQRGSVLKRLERWTEAQNSFLKFLEHHGLSGETRSGAYFHLGTISNTLDKPVAASGHFKKCLELNPDHTAARKALKQGALLHP